MNDLSWFLYLADISQNIKAVLIIMGVLLGIVLGIILMCLFDSYEDRTVGKIWSCIGIIFCLWLIVVGALIPSRHTIYAIAASQAGEQVLKLEEVQALGGDLGGLATDSLKLLRQTINSQLENAND